jgi:hypothetical protein
MSHGFLQFMQWAVSAVPNKYCWTHFVHCSYAQGHDTGLFLDLLNTSQQTLHSLVSFAGFSFLAGLGSMVLFAFGSTIVF